MTGVWRLVRLYVRSNWLLLLVPALLLAGLVIATSSGVKDLYPTSEERAVYAATMGASPASWAFNGRGVDLDSIGGIAAYEVGFAGQLAIPAVGLLLGVGLTRRLEESGVMELVTSGRVARTAVPLAALVVSIASWLLFAKASEAGLYALGFDRLGSQTYPAILALYGMAFTGIGLLAGQLAQGTQAAYGISGLIAVAGFVSRAYIDGRELRYVWVSPMGWVAEAHPWGTWVWWPALSFIALLAVTSGAAVLVASRRDLGSGVLQQRPGRAAATRVLTTASGLAWRLTRGSMIGWAVAALTWCVSLGAMTDEMGRIIAENPTLAEALGGDPTQIETVMSLVLAAVMASAAAVSGMSRLGVEEGDARMGLVLAGAVSRTRVWLAWTGVVAAFAVVTLMTCGLGSGVAQWLTGSSRDAVMRNLGAAIAYVPGVLLVTCVAALLVALSPRLRGLGWLPVGWALVVGLLGEALRLPQWSRDFSPFELVGRVPVETLDRTAWIWLAVAAMSACAAATVRFGSRSLTRG
jgi:ABC-2 type transport system permease protein